MDKTDGATIVPRAEQTIPQLSWGRRALPWAGWCLLFVPLSIVLHELGHLAAAAWLGFPQPELHFSSISHGDVTTASSSAVGIVGLVGPAVTVIITLFACWWVIVRNPAPWAFALCVAAASRFAVGVPYTIVNGVMLMMGRRLVSPAFDEHKAATALGWSGDAVLAGTSLVLIASLLVAAFRIPRGHRSTAWAGLLGGTAIGWVIWMKFLGPAVLP